MRNLIVTIVLTFLTAAWIQSFYPDPLEQPRDYGYVWNMPAELQQADVLRVTHGHYENM